MSGFRIARPIFSANVICILGKKAEQNATSLQKAMDILTFTKYRRISGEILLE